MPEKDPVTGKFIRTADEPEIEPLRLQTRYSGVHTVMIRPTTRRFYPEFGTIETTPGLFAKFDGPNRAFDSVRAQQINGWSDAEREAVEKKLVSHDGFMTDYFPAALTTIPERLEPYARVKGPVKRKYCQAFGWNDEGKLEQCSIDPLPGGDYCATHDPNTTVIKKGLGTTAG